MWEILMKTLDKITLVNVYLGIISTLLCAPALFLLDKYAVFNLLKAAALFLTFSKGTLELSDVVHPRLQSAKS